MLLPLSRACMVYTCRPAFLDRSYTANRTGAPLVREKSPLSLPTHPPLPTLFTRHDAHPFPVRRLCRLRSVHPWSVPAGTARSPGTRHSTDMGAC